MGPLTSAHKSLIRKSEIRYGELENIIKGYCVDLVHVLLNRIIGGHFWTS